MAKGMRSVLEIPKTESPAEIKLKPEMYRVAAEDFGLTFSEYLEQMNPSNPNDKLDAFERQLARYNIRVKSDPRKGYYAGNLAEFFVTDSDSRILFPEFLNRMARWALLTADDDPYDINLITGGNEEGLNENTFKELFIDDKEADYQMSHVGELGGFPEIKVSYSEKAEGMKKYGVAIKWSYEFLRRARIDMIRPVIAKVALMQRRAIFKEGIDKLINGGGTTMTPAASSAAINTFDTDISAAGTLTYYGWLKWLNSRRPHSIDTVFCNFDTAYKIITMTRASVDTLALRESLNPAIANSPALVRGLKADPKIVIIDDADISSNVILGIDSRFAAKRYFEIGADMTETERIINQQFERVVISHVDGFSKIYPAATHVVTLTTS